MTRLSYAAICLALTSAPAFAQNLTIPAGAFSSRGYVDVDPGPVAMAPPVITQGRSAAELRRETHRRHYITH